MISFPKWTKFQVTETNTPKTQELHHETVDSKRTPAYPDRSIRDAWIPFKTVGFSGLGYVLGVRWKILRLILFMEEILHQLICSLSHYIQGLYIPYFTFYHSKSPFFPPFGIIFSLFVSIQQSEKSKIFPRLQSTLFRLGNLRMNRAVDRKRSQAGRNGWVVFSVGFHGPLVV